MNTLSKSLLAGVAAMAMLGMAETASADIYTYTTTNGTYTLNNVTDTGTWAGSAATPGNLSFSFTDTTHATFTGGASSMDMLDLSNMVGSKDGLAPVNGDVGHPGMLDLGSKLWVPWGNAQQVATQTSWTESDIAWGTQTGYTDTPSSSGTSGGTAVPEPGVAGLMGLGLVALFARRRKSVAQGKLALA